MLATEVSQRPQTAREALERLLKGSSVVEPASRALVAQWISELFAGEKAEEVAEISALKSRDNTDENLHWFAEGDEVSTSEFNTEIFEPEAVFGADETVQLIEAGATDRQPVPLPPSRPDAKPRDAKVPTLVLEEDPSHPTLTPRPAVSSETFGPYRLLGKMGEGGMAEVLLAESSKGKCVIKRIAPNLRVDPGYAEMFHEEGRIARMLKHPNIVECLDAGAIDGVLYIAFELIEGVDLAKLIVDMSPEKVPPSAALEMGAAVARALDYAHRLTGEDGRPLQVVHRDVSPENVVIAWSGEVKLLELCDARRRAQRQGRVHGARAARGRSRGRADRSVSAGRGVGGGDGRGAPLSGRVDGEAQRAARDARAARPSSAGSSGEGRRSGGAFVCARSVHASGDGEAGARGDRRAAGEDRRREVAPYDRAGASTDGNDPARPKDGGGEVGADSSDRDRSLSGDRDGRRDRLLLAHVLRLVISCRGRAGASTSEHARVPFRSGVRSR
jgi:hypothetical protein